MKKIIMALLVSGSGFVSCESKETKGDTSTTTTEQKTETADTAAPVLPQALCYASTAGGNNVYLRLEIQGSSVMGKLDYSIKEKDQNKGTISGTMNGDVLIADYTFNSEGVSSVRQVAFQVKDGKATEGYGEMVEKNGKMIFKDPANIAFGEGIVLQQQECN